MGKKVNPIIHRISNNKNSTFTWHSKWIGKKGNFAKYLREDEKIRKLISQEIGHVGIDKIGIERSSEEAIEIILRVSKPGVVIGRGGEKSEKLKTKIQLLLRNPKVRLTIKEIPKANLSAEVLAQEARRMIERRMPFRRVMKTVLD